MRFASWVKGATIVALLIGKMTSAMAALTVGPGCEYASLQSAIDAATGTFEIHVLAHYTSAPVSYSGKAITIIGNYQSCDADAPSDTIVVNALSKIDGSLTSGHAGIEVSGSSSLTLSHFLIDGADHGSANGGGIAYNGSGDHAYLTLDHVFIQYSKAERGAGVFFRGTASTSEMHINDIVVITSNTASISGGGIRLEGNVKLVATGIGDSIDNNTAAPQSDDGAGGGLQLRDSTSAYIGATNAGAAFIAHNHARVGGGVAVQNSANLFLYSAHVGQLSRIEFNDAADAGGGVYIDPDTGPSTFCIVGGGINSNRSSNGGAIFINDNSHPANLTAVSFDLQCNGFGGFPNLTPCVIGATCNTIDLNQVTDPVGAVVDQQNASGAMNMSFIEFRGNTGAQILSSASNQTQGVRAAEFSANLINWIAIANTGGELTLDGVSFGGNAFKYLNNDVFSGGGPLTLRNSIVWAPGQTMFGRPTTLVHMDNLVLSGADHFHPGDFASFNNVRGLDPKFVDEAGADLRLRDDSPAIDAAATGNGLDILQHSRGIDVAQGPDSPNLGPYDLGAYETQFVDGNIPATFPPDETFEERASAHTLPLNWQVVTSSSDAAWTLSDSFPDSGTLSAFVPDVNHVSDSSLTTVPVHVIHNGVLTFRHRVSLEDGSQTVAYDAASLEIQIAGDFFYEIESIGGRFLEGGYDHVVGDNSDNPMAGLPGWSGDHATYSTVHVQLPPNADGKDVRFRWRVATDGNVGKSGYWLDSIHFVPDSLFQDGFDRIVDPTKSVVQ